MATKTITVYEALEESKRIFELIQKRKKVGFIGFYQGIDGEVISGVSREETAKDMNSALKSVQALMSNYKELKAKIALSNATTKVSIGQKEYTIAEAIVRKDLIQEEENLLYELKRQYEGAVNTVTTNNTKINDQEYINKYLQAVLGDTKHRDVDVVNSQLKLYHEKNDLYLFDPNKLLDEITKMEDDIHTFKTQVNFALTAKNATTEITVCFED